MICRYTQVILNIPLFSTTRTNVLYIYSIPPDDGLQISPKHVEAD